MGVQIGMRWQRSTLGDIDAWAAQNGCTRPEAIRRLVEMALATAQPAAPISPKAAAKASKMAGAMIDQLGDKSAPPEEQAKRKRRLIKGPPEFREMRGDLGRPRSSK